ncbi:uncharacterized protein G2W53_003561 [Senna tora]|uniref:Uncharacterized protein n=1 Tax=Senna tora TaxID=362788 RepID=A0A834XBG4_9FABA|nr:uncharacterized protein G2W53_003561 [Senna tora]
MDGPQMRVKGLNVSKSSEDIRPIPQHSLRWYLVLEEEGPSPSGTTSRNTPSIRNLGLRFQRRCRPKRERFLLFFLKINLSELSQEYEEKIRARATTQSSLNLSLVRQGSTAIRKFWDKVLAEHPRLKSYSIAGDDIDPFWLLSFDAYCQCLDSVMWDSISMPSSIGSSYPEGVFTFKQMSGEQQRASLSFSQTGPLTRYYWEPVQKTNRGSPSERRNSRAFRSELCAPTSTKSCGLLLGSRRCNKNVLCFKAWTSFPILKFHFDHNDEGALEILVKKVHALSHDFETKDVVTASSRGKKSMFCQRPSGKRDISSESSNLMAEDWFLTLDLQDMELESSLRLKNSKRGCSLMLFSLCEWPPNPLAQDMRDNIGDNLDNRTVPVCRQIGVVYCGPY